MNIVLADHKYSHPDKSIWEAALSRWVGTNYLVTSETEFAMVWDGLQLSSAEKYVCFIHGAPDFGHWEAALRKREINAIVIRVSTEGTPPREGDAPSIHTCPYTPEAFSNSARVGKFFATLDESPAQALNLLLQTECSRMKALAIFLDCIAVAQVTLVDNGGPNRLDMVALLRDSGEGSTAFTTLTREIAHLLSGSDVPEFSEFLRKLSSVVATQGCDNRPIYASGFLNSIGLDARAACNILTSILNKTP